MSESEELRQRQGTVAKHGCFSPAWLWTSVTSVPNKAESRSDQREIIKSPSSLHNSGLVFGYGHSEWLAAVFEWFTHHEALENSKRYRDHDMGVPCYFGIVWLCGGWEEHAPVSLRRGWYILGDRDGCCGCFLLSNGYKSPKLLQTANASLQSPTSPSNVVYRGTMCCTEWTIMRKLHEHVEQETRHKQVVYKKKS